MKSTSSRATGSFSVTGIQVSGASWLQVSGASWTQRLSDGSEVGSPSPSELVGKDSTIAIAKRNAVFNNIIPLPQSIGFLILHRNSSMSASFCALERVSINKETKR